MQDRDHRNNEDLTREVEKIGSQLRSMSIQIEAIRARRGAKKATETEMAMAITMKMETERASAERVRIGLGLTEGSPTEHGLCRSDGASAQYR